MAHGGTRSGAGRKVQAVTQIRRNFASALLPDKFEIELWTQALKSEDERIALDALKALTDHKYGRATQRVEETGPEGGPIAIRVVTDV